VRNCHDGDSGSGAGFSVSKLAANVCRFCRQDEMLGVKIDVLRACHGKLTNEHRGTQHVSERGSLFLAEVNLTAARIWVGIVEQRELSLSIASGHNTDSAARVRHNVISCADSGELSSFNLYTHSLSVPACINAQLMHNCEGVG
jgi:hypothetical protein